MSAEIVGGLFIFLSILALIGAIAVYLYAIWYQANSNNLKYWKYGSYIAVGVAVFLFIIGLILIIYGHYSSKTTIITPAMSSSIYGAEPPSSQIIYVERTPTRVTPPITPTLPQVPAGYQLVRTSSQ